MWKNLASRSLKSEVPRVNPWFLNIQKARKWTIFRESILTKADITEANTIRIGVQKSYFKSKIDNNFIYIEIQHLFSNKFHVYD